MVKKILRREDIVYTKRKAYTAAHRGARGVGASIQEAQGHVNIPPAPWKIRVTDVIDYSIMCMRYNARERGGAHTVTSV